MPFQIPHRPKFDAISPLAAPLFVVCFLCAFFFQQVVSKYISINCINLFVLPRAVFYGCIRLPEDELGAQGGHWQDNLK